MTREKTNSDYFPPIAPKLSTLRNRNRKSSTSIMREVKGGELRFLGAEHSQNGDPYLRVRMRKKWLIPIPDLLDRYPLPVHQ